ncbi:MAG: hypothetical protein D6704_11545 [Nitrospirae bacterium]|nr:MAG: hypothetical protein D6704_11545 [Nitrospirota bacterium]
MRFVCTVVPEPFAERLADYPSLSLQMIAFPNTPADIPESRIHALIQLLNETDPHIVQTIHHHLLMIGPPALPHLRWAKQAYPHLSAQLTHLIEHIHDTHLEQAFKELSKPDNPSIDLETGAFLIARTAYPELAIDQYRARLDEMAETLRTQIGPTCHLKTAIQIVNHYLFHEQGFRGNRQDYYDPDNSFLNVVLDRRVGIPISLSVLYLLIGYRLRLPVVGVGMPGHFIVGVPSISLYIDCFHGGTLLTDADCARTLRELGYGFDARYLQPTSHKQILARMLRNLIAIFTHHQDTHHVTRYTRFLSIIESLTTSKTGDP